MAEGSYSDYNGGYITITADIVEGLTNGFLRKRYDSPALIPEFHREMWSMCCSEYKFVAIAAPRG